MHRTDRGDGIDPEPLDEEPQDHALARAQGGRGGLELVPQLEPVALPHRLDLGAGPARGQPPDPVLAVDMAALLSRQFSASR